MISKWLFVGVGVLVLVLGYTVGASSSPVASAIIPALFTLVTAASVVALRKNISKNKLLSLSHLFGVFLLVVSATYFIGTIFGANARESGIFILSKQEINVREFPWELGSEPADIQVALDWIGVQEKLLVLGYTKKQIETLYSLPGAQQYSGIGIYGQAQRLTDFLQSEVESSAEFQTEKPKTIVDTDLLKDDGA